MQGLLRYNYYDSQSKDVTLLTTHVSSSSAIDPGSQITYANDLAIASDGTIYFTSCTDIVPQLNRQGFYDTYRAWYLSLMRVSWLLRNTRTWQQQQQQC
jgi:sugar lactone lactonase YvrE